jgi:hypothetical protein
MIEFVLLAFAVIISQGCIVNVEIDFQTPADYDGSACSRAVPPEPEIEACADNVPEYVLCSADEMKMLRGYWTCVPKSQKEGSFVCCAVE